MSHHDRAFVVNKVITVGSDDFIVKIIVSRPEEPDLDRDMEIIKSEVDSDLENWISVKIQSGESP